MKRCNPTAAWGIAEGVWQAYSALDAAKPSAAGENIYGLFQLWMEIGRALHFQRYGRRIP